MALGWLCSGALLQKCGRDYRMERAVTNGTLHRHHVAFDRISAMTIGSFRLYWSACNMAGAN